MYGSPCTLAKAIHAQTGIFLPEDRYYLFDSRLAEVIKDYALQSYDEVAMKLLRGDEPAFVDRVIDRMSTHETRFFRDESLFQALSMQMIPEWIQRNGVTLPSPSTPPLEILSAACSTGQEIYSIAMMIREQHPALLRSIKLTASDISPMTLKRAVDGIYSPFEIKRGLPQHYLEEYFGPEGDGFRVCESLRNMPRFVVQNLLEPIKGTYDIIFCRNVLIYFNEMHRMKALANVVNALKPDGVLALGSAESPTEYLENFVIREFGLARVLRTAAHNSNYVQEKGRIAEWKE